MKKLLAPLLILMLALSIFPLFGSVHGATSVGGLITSDTVWSQAGSPYQLTGPVGVLNGVTLTILPGATIYLRGYYIQINGTFNAQGTNNNNIVFFGGNQNNDNNYGSIQFMPYSSKWNDQQTSGSIISNAFCERVSLKIQGSSPMISRNTFNSSSIDSQGGSPTIQYNLIKSNGGLAGITASDSAIISNNVIEGKAGWGGGIGAQGNVQVLNNLVDNCLQGIVTQGSVVIEGNTVTNTHGKGICSSDASAKITKNYVAYNRVGLMGSGIIENNAVLYNEVGFSHLGSATISNNNILGNTDKSISLSDSNNVNMANNWWGTTDSQTISQTIHDSKSDFNLGTVTYEPFLTSPNSEAPTEPLAQISLPTPNPSNLNQPTNQPNNPTQSPQPTPVSGWSSFVGSNSSGPNTAWEATILEVAQIVLVGLGIVWLVVLSFFAVKRVRKQKGVNP
jgi:hypothetical protein